LNRIASGLLLAALSCATAPRAFAQQDNDHTLQAMRDEMARAKTRLELKIPGTDKPVRPYYLEYRLLDLDVLFQHVGAQPLHGCASPRGQLQAGQFEFR
jgi:hypothetical protein